MERVTISTSVIEDTMEALDEHAATLQALSRRLDKVDQEAALSTSGIAQELWEIRKELGDTRHRYRSDG